MDLTDGNISRIQHSLQQGFPIAHRTRPAAIQIDCRVTGFRKRVARQVRLAEQIQAGHAARTVELMPDRLTNDVQVDKLNHGLAQATHGVDAGQRFGCAAGGVDDPLRAVRHERFTSSVQNLR